MQYNLIEFEASSEVRNVINEISRTEDVRLSPDNNRLAVADFSRNLIYLFTVHFSDIGNDTDSPQVDLNDYLILSSDNFHQPHGIAFLNNDHLIVCNRSTDVCLFEIPTHGDSRRTVHLKPQKTINGNGLLFAKVKTPGSVDCYKSGDNRYRALVCNNHWHFISLHEITLGKKARIRNDGVLIQNSLKLPDGLSISHDQRWIAVSNHVDGEILIYANNAQLNKITPPVAFLKGAVCPHGLRFTSNGLVLVADAASQYLHVFNNNDGTWDGEYYPQKSLRMMDDETFYNGRYASREGGLKGIDIDISNRVLISTHRFGVLEFYDLRSLLSREGITDQEEIVRLRSERDQSFMYQEGKMLTREWTLKSRLWRTLRSYILPRQRLKQYAIQTQRRIDMWHMKMRNRWSNEPVIQANGPVLSMATNSQHLEDVYFTLDSISMGNMKPGRAILWITGEDSRTKLPTMLQRLKSRGLEIFYTQDFGPHTKYFPYIDQESILKAPLVTANVGMLYPRDWLEHLIKANKSDPMSIHCFCAQHLGLQSGLLLPYFDWLPCQEGSQPSHFNYINSAYGVIFPPDYLLYLKQQGDSFSELCPDSDDIWFNVNALRSGFKVAQINNNPCTFMRMFNLKGRSPYIDTKSGLIQYQLRKTYRATDLALLHETANCLASKQIA